MSDYLKTKLGEATPEDLQKLLANFKNGKPSPEQQQLQDMIGNVMQGKCAFRDILGIDDKQMEALYAVGYNFYTSGRFDDAIKVFRGLCLFDQLTFKYWLGLGAALQSAKQYQEAVKIYGMALIIKATDPRPPFHAAECFIALNDRENAINSLHTVLNLAENNPSSKPFVDKANTILKLLEENPTQTPEK